MLSTSFLSFMHFCLCPMQSRHTLNFIAIYANVYSNIFFLIINTPLCNISYYSTSNYASCAKDIVTRRLASTDRTARRQFQATGQPVSRTQASDAITSRLPRYEAKCVQRTCFQCGSVPLRSYIKGTELPPLDRQLIALQLCCRYNETLQ